MLSKDNASVRKEADGLKAQVEMLTRENRQLRLQQQISNSRLQRQTVPESTPQLGSNFWGMQQGRNSNMGMPILMGGGVGGGDPSTLSQGLGANALSQGLGANALSQGLGVHPMDSISRPQTDPFLSEQAREYLRELQERTGSLR